MSCIYKEKSGRDKLPFLVLIVLMAVIFLSVSKLAKAHLIPESFEIVVDIVLFGFFAYFIYLMSRSIDTVMKYSLISGELLIHKKVHGQEVLTQRVYLSDVEEVAPVCGIGSKLMVSLKDISFLSKKCYKVTYNENGTKKDLYLRSSNKLISKIEDALEENGKEISSTCVG